MATCHEKPPRVFFPLQSQASARTFVRTCLITAPLSLAFPRSCSPHFFFCSPASVLHIWPATNFPLLLTLFFAHPSPSNLSISPRLVHTYASPCPELPKSANSPTVPHARTSTSSIRPGLSAASVFTILTVLTVLTESSGCITRSCGHAMSDSAARQWTLVLVLTALFLSVVVLAQIVTRFGAAYWAAPREMAALLDSADSSLLENESYDRDVARVPRLDDRIRLGRLLREIQRAGEDLREDLNAVLASQPTDLQNQRLHSQLSFSSPSYPSVSSGLASRRRQNGLQRRSSSPSPSSPPSRPSSSAVSPSFARLTTSARILWAAKRTRLEERLRRLDLLRMRFLVVYMSIVAASAAAAADKVEKSAAFSSSPPLSSAASSVNASSLPSSPRDLGNIATLGAIDDRLAAFRYPALDYSYAAHMAAWVPPPLSPPYPHPPHLSHISPPPPPPPPPPPLPPLPSSSSDPDQSPPAPRTPARQSYLLHNSPPALPFDILESIRQKPALRRVSTLPPAVASSPEHRFRTGWMGVVQELQRSPLLHKRHTSVETSTAAAQR